MGIQQLYKKCLVPAEAGAIAGTNEDLLPTPPERRTWSQWDYIATWTGPSFDVNQWNTGSSFISVGLTVTQVTCPVIVGSLIAACAITSMGMYGSRYGVGFPSLVRSTFGVGGSKWVVTLRGLVGVIWYGVESLYIAQMMKVAFRCIFGYKWHEWAPALPEGTGATAQLLLAFFLTWTLIFPLALVHPSKLKWWFTARSIIGPIVYFSLFAWAVHLGLTKSGETFPGFVNLQPSTLQGASLAWAMLSAINSVLASIAPQVTNVSDITRYAKTPKAAGWLQGVTFFGTKVLSIFLSIFAASFLKYRYNQEVALWNVWEQLDLILDNEWSAKSRFGAFCIAVGFGFSTTMTNTYANTVPFGADISSLVPKLFTIVRGQVLIAILSLAVVPWKLFASGAEFLTFLGSYTFFMASLTGPMLIDYYVLRRGNIHVPSLYNRDPKSIYCFNSRVRSNWRAVGAFIGGVAMILPGLVQAYMPDKVGSPASRMYSFGWVISVATSAVLYWGANKVWPVPLLPPGNEELAKSLKFHEMSLTDGRLPAEAFSSTGSLVPDDSDAEKKGNY